MENNKNYIVIAAHCNVAHRRARLKRGDVKPASYFEVDQLNRLVQAKYLAEHTGEVAEPAGEPTDPPVGDPPAGEPNDPPAGDPPAGDPPAGEPTKFDAEKATVSELKIELTKLNIPFAASALKADLVKAYNDSFLN